MTTFADDVSDMRIFVEHSVSFVFDDPGDVVRTRDGHYARLNGVTVHLSDREPRVWAGGIRCRKNGVPDKRMGKVGVSVVLPDPDAWIERAWAAVSVAPAPCPHIEETG